MNKIHRHSPKQAELRTKMLAEAMASLVLDTRFRVYMDCVYDMHEQAVRDSINDAVIGDHGKMAGALGEIRAFTALIDQYEHHINNPPEPVELPPESSPV